VVAKHPRASHKIVIERRRIALELACMNALFWASPPVACVRQVDMTPYTLRVSVPALPRGTVAKEPSSAMLKEDRPKYDDEGFGPGEGGGGEADETATGHEAVDRNPMPRNKLYDPAAAHCSPRCYGRVPDMIVCLIES
jgi:hypothetical protein